MLLSYFHLPLLEYSIQYYLGSARGSAGASSGVHPLQCSWFESCLRHTHIDPISEVTKLLLNLSRKEKTLTYPSSGHLKSWYRRYTRSVRYRVEEQSVERPTEELINAVFYLVSFLLHYINDAVNLK